MYLINILILTFNVSILIKICNEWKYKSFHVISLDSAQTCLCDSSIPPPMSLGGCIKCNKSFVVLQLDFEIRIKHNIVHFSKTKF